MFLKTLIGKIRVSTGLKLIIRNQFWFRNMISLKTCQMCLLMLTIILSGKINGLPKLPLLNCQMSIWNLDLIYTPVKNREECIKPALYSLVRAHAQITKENQRVPSWSRFYELVSKPDLYRITVGYLPSLTFLPTKTKVIAAEIRRMQDVMKELETDFIFTEFAQAIYTKVLDVMLHWKIKVKIFFLP